jgi:hypothetical protein
MAFECGVLAQADNRSPRGALDELLGYLQAEIPYLAFAEAKSGEGWVATEVKVSLPGEVSSEQYLHVSIGGEILDGYLEDARAVLGEAELRGKDLMLTTIQSGVTDRALNEKLMAYAVTQWHGILWDEVSGFGPPEEVE